MSSEHPAATTVLEPGVVLDRYELLSIVARGGMANVWLARFKGKHGFEKLVAIKTILPELAGEKRFQRMFLDEARIASGIKHPNVAQILDLGEWYDTIYLVMEFVDGDSLSRLRKTIDQKSIKLPLRIAMRVLSDVWRGLHAGHELRGPGGKNLGVVHRDVSPQNVLINESGVVKLIDFGVAKALGRLEESTSGGMTKGKSRYMAPEQATGNAIDRRADIFGVGAMAFQLFAGLAPYDGPNDMARLHSLISGVDITELPQCPHPLVEKIIVKALSRDPEKRYATAAELRTAFEDAIAVLKVRSGTDDVAAFVGKHMESRANDRKRLMAIAIDAAEKRQGLKDMLDKQALAGPPEARESSESGPSLTPTPPPSLTPAKVHSVTPATPSGMTEGSRASTAGGDRTKRTWQIGLIAAAAVVLVTGGIVLAKRSGTATKETAATTSTRVAVAPAPTETVAAVPTPVASVTSKPSARPMKPPAVIKPVPTPTPTKKRDVVIQ